MKATINTYKKSFVFHREEHEPLTTALLEEINKEIDLTLKVQKASIQLISQEPFAVLGYRRSKPSVFIEFYTLDQCDNARIVQTITAKNGLPLHRVIIENLDDINAELLNWVLSSAAIVDSQK